MVEMSEDPQSGASPDTPVSPDANVPVSPDVGQDVTPAKPARLSDIVVSHLADQARQTAQGAKARRVATTDGQPGVADLTPLRELFTELFEEARKMRLQERVARALRRAADMIDPPSAS